MSNKQQQQQNTCQRSIKERARQLKGFIGKFLRRVLDGIESEWPEESWTTFVLWICSIIIDPFALYVPRINDSRKSLIFDRSFLIIISIIYFLFSSLKLIIYLVKYKNKLSTQPKLWRIFVLGAPFVPILANGLLQILLLYKSTSDIKASLFSLGMAVFLILYLVRVLGIYRLFIATALRESGILRILNNLLLYFYGGHLFGGLWYFFSVWKKMQCWYTACSIHKECHYDDRHFYLTSGGYELLDETCFNTTEDNTYELGIFKDALLSHIVDSPNLGKKLMYSLRWGIQNLSGYGQNLSVSTHAWENVFVLVIAVYGMATFTFFIGNMQDLLKSPTRKSNRWRREDLEKWSPFGKLSMEDQDRIVAKCEEYKWPQSGDVNVKNLLSNLSKEAQNYIKRILCSTLLRKVGAFTNWSEEWINELCDNAKIVSYEEHSQIMKNGSSIEEMVLVLEGKIRIYSITNGKKSVTEVEDEGIYGETLVNWFQTNPNSTQLPISDTTTRVVRPVDAFVIVSDDLQYVINQQQSASSSSP